MKINIILALVITLLSSCVREEIIDVQHAYEEKLVVYSIITPGDSLFVKVSKAIPFGEISYNYDQYLITEASVTISRDDEVIRLPLVNKEKAIYGVSQESFQVIPGGIYSLKVVADGKEVNAICTVPKSEPEWRSFDYTLVEEEDEDYEDYVHYRAEVIGTWISKTIKGGYFVFSNSKNVSDNPGDTLFTRVLREGEVTNLDSLYQLDVSIGYSPGSSQDFYIVLMEPNHAQFKESYNIYYDLYSDTRSDEFVGVYRGIIPEFTNIDGGLGIFGAFLKSEKRTVYF